MAETKSYHKSKTNHLSKALLAFVEFEVADDGGKPRAGLDMCLRMPRGVVLIGVQSALVTHGSFD